MPIENDTDRHAVDQRIARTHGTCRDPPDIFSQSFGDGFIGIDVEEPLVARTLEHLLAHTAEVAQAAVGIFKPRVLLHNLCAIARSNLARRVGRPAVAHEYFSKVFDRLKRALKCLLRIKREDAYRGRNASFCVAHPSIIVEGGLEEK